MSSPPRPGIDDLLFRPRNIAIVGASDNPEKISGRPLEYLRRFGYAGQIFPVNPRRSQVQGIRSYPSIASVPVAVDLALVVLPADAVPTALRECAKAGAGAAIVFASGFAECGPEGEKLQNEIGRIADETQLRIVGPNCLGSFSSLGAAFATFSSAFDEPGETPDGPLAFASQSGAVGTFIYSSLVSSGVGTRYFVNTGNETDVTVPEMLESLARADDVKVLLGYLEGIRDERQLADAARTAASQRKPLIVLKSGRSSSGSRAVAAHTASDAGDDARFDELLHRHGAIRVHGMEPMIDAALAFANGRRATGRRLTIVTLSGGAGALATDAAVEAGLVVDEWSPAARAAMSEIVPAFGSTANPIDVTGSLLTDPGILDRTLANITADPGTDVIAVVLGNADRGSQVIVDGVRRAYASTDKPLVVAWTGGSGLPRQQLLGQGVPTYTDPARAVRALAHVVEHSMANRSTKAPSQGSRL